MDGPGRMSLRVRVWVVERVFARPDKVMIAELRPFKTNQKSLIDGNENLYSQLKKIFFWMMRGVIMDAF